MKEFQAPDSTLYSEPLRVTLLPPRPKPLPATSPTPADGIRKDELPGTESEGVPHPNWNRPPDLAPEYQKAFDELFKDGTGATLEQESEPQILTREKLIADNVRLGGRPDDHPLIMKWRQDIGPIGRRTKFSTYVFFAAVATAFVLALFGRWGPAGIAAVSAVILFAVAAMWQSVERSGLETTRRHSR